MFDRRRRAGSLDLGPHPDADPDPPGAAAGGDGQTIIGARTRFRGRLRGRGAVLVCGSLVGEIDILGGLTVAPTGRLEAEVDVHTAELCGEARGSMRATSRVLLDTSAVFEGRMTTPVIDLRPGAVLRGRASIAGGPPPVRRKHTR